MCDANPEIARAVLRSMREYDVPEAAARVSARVACIQGSSWPTNVEGNRRYAHGFDAVVVEGAGHFPQIEKPAEFNRELRALLAS